MSLLPKLPQHRPSAATKAAYADGVAAFCATILKVQSRLDFAVGSRGWAYILEGDRLINKGEINAAQNLINICRKNGDGNGSTRRLGRISGSPDGRVRAPPLAA